MPEPAESVWIVVSWDDGNRDTNIEGVYSTQEKAEARVEAVRAQNSIHAMQPQAIDYGVDEDA